MEGAGFFIMVARTRTWMWPLLGTLTDIVTCHSNSHSGSSASDPGVFPIAGEYQWISIARIEARSLPAFTISFKKGASIVETPPPITMIRVPGDR